MYRDGTGEGGTLPEALDFQAGILGGVSRTFALTIPSLPDPLRVPVTNAYLLCRIADTIEDDPALPVDEKRAFGQRFVDVLTRRAGPGEFARALLENLAPGIPDDERKLVARSPEVVRVTHSFEPRQQDALVRCVALMSDGMHRFQNGAGLRGLDTQRDLDEYCYFVAGVVGEMLTELFCSYSARIARHRDRLMSLAPSFGQGLQMTNILKDIRDDRQRGVCWLPRSAFGRGRGDDDLLGSLDSVTLQRGIQQLAVVAHGHLRNALEYTLLIPRRYQGVRRFCLWALGMAVPTLGNIHAHPGFRSGDEVKITRPQVRRIVRGYAALAGSNTGLRWLFRRASSGLPESDPGVADGLQEISRRADRLTCAHHATVPAGGSYGAS